MAENTAARKKFRFEIWIPVFIVLLSAIPLLTIYGQKNLAKVVGITTVVLTAFAIRRWLYFANKLKGRPSKINLNLNDRYWLNEHIHFYTKLDRAGKKIFEDRISLFVTDIIITEVGKEVPDRDVCLYVASSAVITFWGLPYWNYGRLSEVLVYPDNFNDDNSIDHGGHVMGKVHHGGLMDTTMILSRPALEYGFKNHNDKRNVGVHEFAHLLDKADGEIDGLPEGMSASERANWIKLCVEEMTEIVKGHSDINSYAATNRSEFFAVIIEYYKESPELLAKKHPEISAALDQYFSKD